MIVLGGEQPQYVDDNQRRDDILQLSVIQFERKDQNMTDELIVETDPEGAVLSTYQKRSLLGTGGFAQCYQVVDTQTRKKYAAKIVPKKDLQDRKTKAKLLLQIKIHRVLRHKNIVGFQKVFEDFQNVYIIMELCQNQTLKQFQRRRCRLTEFQVRCYTLQLIDGIEYLHSANIIHRDLKLGNVFINSKMQLKIGDFGLSTKLKSAKDRRYTTCGTPNYIAPEILAETGHSFEVDIWALGVMIYALLIGKPAFECQSVENTYQKIKIVEYNFPPSIPLSDQAKDLVANLLKKNPAERLTLSQMRMHPFLNKETNKVPDLLPAYTISIPPEGSYLRQYIPDKIVKITIMPKRVNRFQQNDQSKQNQHYNSNEKNVKPQLKQTFLSNGNIRKPDLDKQILQPARGRILTQHGNVEKTPSTNIQIPKSARSYETDLNQVTKHIDMSNKYGVGVIFSNGNSGAVYNDGTALARLVEGGFIYYDKKESKLSSLPENLKKKHQILKLMQQRLNCKVQLEYYSRVYAKKFVRFQNILVIKLSNGVLQFFWDDSSTLTLKGYKWISYKIHQLAGQGIIFGTHSQPLESRVQTVRSFLKTYSAKHLASPRAK